MAKNTVVELRECGEVDVNFANNCSKDTKLAVPGSFSERFFKRRTTCEKCLTFIILLLLIAFVTVFCLFVAGRGQVIGNGKEGLAEELSNKHDIRTEDQSEGNSKSSESLCSDKGQTDAAFCNTKECLTTVKPLMDSMDPMADPCEDFYQYACGNWLERNFAEQGEKVGVHDNIRKAIHHEVTGMLQSPVADSDSISVQKAKRLFSSCRDNAAAREKGIAPLIELIDEIGGWPALSDEWSEQSFDRQKFLANMRFLADDTRGMIFRLYNINNRVMIGLESCWYDHPRDITDYVRETLQMLDPELDSDRVLKEAKEINFVYNKLQNVSCVRRSDPPQYMNISGLAARIPQIDWKLQLSSLPEDMSSKDRYLIYKANLIQQIGTIFVSLGNRTLANYLMWRVVESTFGYLDANFFLLANKYHPTRFIEFKDRFSLKYCTELTKFLLKYVVATMFNAKHVTKKEVDETKEMFQLLKENVASSLNSSKWMSAKSKSYVLEKISYLALKLNMLDGFQTVDELYQDMEASESFFKSALSAKKAVLKVTLSLGVLNSRIEALEAAAYNVLSEYIEIKTGFYQTPLFSPFYTKSAKYGGLGFTIAHEVFHVLFSNARRAPDRQSSTSEHIAEMEQCIIERYSNYTELSPQANMVPAARYTDEALCDIGAMKVAFQVYQSVDFSPLDEERLRYLNLTHDQVFFLTFARSWCAVYAEDIRQRVIFSIHPPNRYRVLEAASNSEEFAKAYGCPVGSKMNPVNKCKVV